MIKVYKASVQKGITPVDSIGMHPYLKDYLDLNGKAIQRPYFLSKEAAQNHINKQIEKSEKAKEESIKRKKTPTDGEIKVFVLFCKGLTATQVANKLNVTPERIRQIKAKFLRRFNLKMKDLENIRKLIEP